MPAQAPVTADIDIFRSAKLLVVSDKDERLGPGSPRALSIP